MRRNILGSNRSHASVKDQSRVSELQDHQSGERGAHHGFEVYLSEYPVVVRDSGASRDGYVQGKEENDALRVSLSHAGFRVFTAT